MSHPNAPGTIQGRAYQFTSAPVDLGDMLPVRVGVVTFEDDLTAGCEDFAEYVSRLTNTVEFLNLLELSEDDYDNIEWSDGCWYLYSDHPAVLAEFSDSFDGCDATEIEPFFIEAAVAEVKNNPRRYPKVDPHAIANEVIDQYYLRFDESTGQGHFMKKPAVEAQEPRASADLNVVSAEEAEDGSEY